MKKTIYILSVIVAVAFLSACGNQEKSREKNTPGKKSVVEPSVQPENSGDLMGVWLMEKKGRWIEFHADGTYSMGMPDRNPIEGNQYEYDKEKGTITLQAKKGPRIFKVGFADQGEVKNLLLTPEGKEKSIRYTKVDKRPVE